MALERSEIERWMAATREVASRIGEFLATAEGQAHPDRAALQTAATTLLALTGTAEKVAAKQELVQAQADKAAAEARIAALEAILAR